MNVGETIATLDGIPFDALADQLGDGGEYEVRQVFVLVNGAQTWRWEITRTA